jgi:hypothetical protein
MGMLISSVGTRADVQPVVALALKVELRHQVRMFRRTSLTGSPDWGSRRGSRCGLRAPAPDRRLPPSSMTL